MGVDGFVVANHAAIDHQLDLLAAAKRRGRVNLNDVDEVEATATAYMTSCKRAGVYPTMLGFSAACGYSRKAIYEYIARHSGKSVDYLDGLRSSWAAIIAQMGLARQCSESVSIFLLKNCGQGMADRAEIDIAPKTENPLGERKDPEELRRKYLEDVYGADADKFLESQDREG